MRAESAGSSTGRPDADAEAGWPASVTAHGHVSIVHGRFERYRICRAKEGWRVHPMFVGRSPSRKAHPTAVDAARAYFRKAAMARLVAGLEVPPGDSQAPEAP